MVPEYVTVTLRSEYGAALGDYRLPTDVPVQKLYPLLAQALRMELKGGTIDALYYQGCPIVESRTLADHGIWDGSILMLKESAV